jgi:hypothetical protein
MSDAGLALQALKAFNYALLIAINLLFVISLAWLAYHRQWYALACACIGLTPIAILGCLGFIEQRYLVTSHYFMILAISSLFLSKSTLKLGSFSSGNQQNA